MSFVIITGLLVALVVAINMERLYRKRRSDWLDYALFLKSNELSRDQAAALLASAGVTGRFRTGRGPESIDRMTARAILAERDRYQQRDRGQDRAALKSAAYGAVAGALVSKALDAAPMVRRVIDDWGPSMTHAQLISQAARDAGVSQADAGRILEAIVREVHRSLAARTDVRISNLGVFDTTERSAREGRNPATGAIIRIPPSREVRFRVAKSLKDAVQAEFDRPTTLPARGSAPRHGV